MNKALENMNLKIFEDKQEKIEDAQFAKSLFIPEMFNALPVQVNRKVFTPLDYKQS